METPELRSLSTGIIATAEITCDDAEAVGHRLQSALDGVAVSNAKIKRSHQIKTLASLLPGIKVGDMH